MVTGDVAVGPAARQRSIEQVTSGLSRAYDAVGLYSSCYTELVAAAAAALSATPCNGTFSDATVQPFHRPVRFARAAGGATVVESPRRRPRVALRYGKTLQRTQGCGQCHVTGGTINTRNLEVPTREPGAIGKVAQGPTCTRASWAHSQGLPSSSLAKPQGGAWAWWTDRTLPGPWFASARTFFARRSTERDTLLLLMQDGWRVMPISES